MVSHPADTILPGERAAHPAPTLVMKVRGAKGSYVEHGGKPPGNYCNTSPTSGMFEDDDFSELTQGGICFPFLEGKLHSGSTQIFWVSLVGLFTLQVVYLSKVSLECSLFRRPGWEEIAMSNLNVI